VYWEGPFLDGTLDGTMHFLLKGGMSGLGAAVNCAGMMAEVVRDKEPEHDLDDKERLSSLYSDEGDRGLEVCRGGMGLGVEYIVAGSCALAVYDWVEGGDEDIWEAEGYLPRRWELLEWEEGMPNGVNEYWDGVLESDLVVGLR
jgi:hypothetical protein